MTAVSGGTNASSVLRGLSSDWTLVHDGSTPESSDADHVVVGPGGIFLVSVRDRPGPAYALSRDDDILACTRSADVVAEMSGTYTRWVRPVLCIAGDAELLDQALDVLVCSTATLSTALTSAPGVLTAQQCDEAVALLRGAPAEGETTAPPPADPAPRGKRARQVDPNSEPESPVDLVAAEHQQPAGKRARVFEPETPPVPVADVVPVLVVPPVPPVPPMSVPMIKREPRPQRVVARAPVDEAAAPVEPEVALTGRAKRVAEAMATRDPRADRLAELQAKDGSATGARAKRSRSVGKVVKLAVAAVIVGVLALNGPRLVSTAGTWGPDLWAQLNGRSGSASACAVASADPSATPRPAAAKVTAKRAARKVTPKASRSKAGRRAAARAKRQRQKAAATPRTPALETPVC